MEMAVGEGEGGVWWQSERGGLSDVKSSSVLIEMVRD